MDAQIENKIDMKDALDLLPKHVELTYAAYNDNLDDREDILQECIEKQDFSPLDDELMEWQLEQEADSIDTIVEQLKDDLLDEWDESDVDSFLEDNYDAIREELYNRDNSSMLHDLLRNTTDPVCFYDTGLYIDSESWTWSRSELLQWRNKVKRAVKIEQTNHHYDREIESMLCEASYGGRLVVFFNLDLSDDFNNMVNAKYHGYNAIKFTNPMIAVIDNINGSGDHTQLPRHTFILGFDVSNLVFDRTMHYNYTYSVCGMYSNWCDCTGYELMTVTDKKIWGVKKSNLSAERNRDKHYKEVFKAGKCSLGDIDMSRHRHTYYDNNFPCGTHCRDCGQFWID